MSAWISNFEFLKKKKKKGQYPETNLKSQPQTKTKQQSINDTWVIHGIPPVAQTCAHFASTKPESKSAPILRLAFARSTLILSKPAPILHPIRAQARAQSMPMPKLYRAQTLWLLIVCPDPCFFYRVLTKQLVRLSQKILSVFGFSLSPEDIIAQPDFFFFIVCLGIS